MRIFLSAVGVAPDAEQWRRTPRQRDGASFPKLVPGGFLVASSSCKHRPRIERRETGPAFVIETEHFQGESTTICPITWLGRSRPAADASREVVERWLLDGLDVSVGHRRCSCDPSTKNDAGRTPAS